MTTQELKTFFMEYEEKLSAYGTVLALCSFDASTIAPSAGAEYRNKMISIVQGDYFSIMTNQDSLAKLDELDKKEDLDAITKEALRQRLRSLRDIRILPKELYIEFQKCCADADVLWRKAKREENYALFEGTLIRLIEIQKKLLSYRNDEGSDYQKLLDDYEVGMTIEKYDEFFSLIKEKLIPFIKKVADRKSVIDDSMLYGYFPAEKQAKLMKVLQDYMNYDPDRVYMGETEHPFTMKISNKDTRITTKYVENSLASSIFSIIHEYGHALYGMQVDSKYDGMILADGMSSGMHESQSRFLENYIGKRESYWVCNYPKLQEIFPEFNEVELTDFVKMINASYPSLIRTEADELTYPLHILIRYELEKEIFDGNLDLSNLENEWNDRVEKYLGIRPSKPSQGILQDMHWASAMFGYFPTYALGSAYAAQFFNAMQKEVDVDKALSDNDFAKIQSWLKEKIHHYGSFKRADEILMEVTREKFNPNYYIDGLIEKYSKLYGLEMKEGK